MISSIERIIWWAVGSMLAEILQTTCNSCYADFFLIFLWLCYNTVRQGPCIHSDRTLGVFLSTPMIFILFPHCEQTLHFSLYDPWISNILFKPCQAIMFSVWLVSKTAFRQKIHVLLAVCYLIFWEQVTVLVMLNFVVFLLRCLSYNAGRLSIGIHSDGTLGVFLSTHLLVILFAQN